MTELLPMNASATVAPQVRGPAEFCRYCGSSLDPFYYFCTGCATPYKREEEVLPIVRPMVLTDGMLIERKAPMVAPLFWTYFAVVVGVAVLSFVLFTTDHPELALIFQSAAILITTGVFGAVYWKSLVAQLKTLGFLHWEAWAAIGALAPLLLINLGYYYVLTRGLELKGTDLIQRLREAGVSESALVFAICILPAVTEEIAFRGLLQHWLQIAVRPGRAILLAAALFAALHFSIFSFPYLLAVGLLLGWAKWRTGSLYPSMLIHFLHNLVVIVFFHF